MTQVVNATDSHPMKEGWAELRQSPRAELSYDPSPFEDVLVDAGGTTPSESALRHDAVAAYAHALQWVVTGDERHSAKGVEILDAWSSKLRTVEPTRPRPAVQDELEVAWYGPIWLAAAEIFRHCADSGWTAAGVTQFDQTVGLFRAKALAWEGSRGCCPNQAVSVALARTTLGVYMDDPSLFQDGIRLARETMLSRAIGPDGQVLEINRRPQGDCVHAAYNIEGLVSTAEVAFHQGTDLYGHRLDGEPHPRLLLGVEYLSQLIVSGAQTTEPGFVRCEDLRPNSIEIAFNHFVGRRGLEMPQTKMLLESIRPVGEGTSKFIPWDTLTHAGLDPS